MRVLRAVEITADEQRAAGRLLARIRDLGVSFGDARVVVQRDTVTGRLSVAASGRTYSELPGGRLIAARVRPDGGVELADLDGPCPRAFQRLMA